MPVSSNGATIDYYKPDVQSAQDYYPFGMLQPGRSYNAGGYRYGFNGKENDNEVKGEGNQQDYGMRIYDPRVGRFLSVDPITEDYPELTPYQFASNRPIDGIDRDGLEWWSGGDPVMQGFTWPVIKAAFRAWVDGGIGQMQSGIQEKTAVETRQHSYHNDKVPEAVQKKLDNINDKTANLKIAAGVSTLTANSVETSFDVTSSFVPLEEIFVAGKESYNIFKYSQKAKTLAYKTAKQVIADVPKGKLPRAVTVIVDESTGKAYTGISGGIKDVEKLNPELKSLLPEKSMEKWPVQNCAECDAMNKAMNDGAKLKDLHMHTVKIDKKTGKVADFRRCENCKVTTKDVQAHSDN